MFEEAGALEVAWSGHCVILAPLAYSSNDGWFVFCLTVWLHAWPAVLAGRHVAASSRCATRTLY